MAPQQPISIIGCGIAGLVLGRCLKAKGIPAILYERASASPRHTYSITLLPWAYQPLVKILGMDIGAFRHRVAVDDSHKAASGNAGTDTIAPFRAYRGSLEGLLGEGLDIRWDHKLAGLEKGAKQITLTFQNGQNVDCNLVVGADGVHSQVRKSMAPDSQLKVLPFVVFNGKRRMSPDDFEPIAKYFRGVNTLEARIGDALLQAYINEYKEAQVNLSYTYSRSPRESSDPLHHPDRPAQSATDIPEEFFEELGQTKGLDEPWATIFSPEKVRQDRVLHWLMRSVMVSSDEMAGAARDGVALLGDALHATPILGSEGANLAMKDSLDLADSLAQDGDLGDFFASRYDGWQHEVQESEERLAMMHSQKKASL